MTQGATDSVEQQNRLSHAPDTAGARRATAQNAPAGGPPNQEAAPLRRDDFDRDVWCLLGIPIDISDLDRTVAAIDASVREGRRLSFVTPNVNWLVRALRNEDARNQMLDADLSLADGAPLALFARMLGVPIGQRTAGSDIFEALRRRPGFAGRRLKVFFFGGRDGAAEQAVKALNAEQGGVEAVGWHNPGFGDVESMSDDAVIAKINAAAPDFVVVALGAAKGQAWIGHNKDRLTAPTLAHLGAVIDFTAGAVARAPRAFQKMGLEWAWRIKEEPSLWRRYFEDGLALAGIAVTRLAPQLLRARRRGGAADEKAPGAAKPRSTGSIQVVKLSGALTQSFLRPVRQAFREAAHANGDVVLDFSRVAFMDRAFLGLVLMLEKHLKRRGAGLFVHGAASAHKKLLAANAMRYSSIELQEIAAPAITTRRRAAI